MKKIFISAIVVFMLTSCASQNIEQTKVADAQTVEKQSKEKKSYRDCKKKITGSRTRRC
jgi:outer membrane biogenesis lipoprotein LolB